MREAERLLTEHDLQDTYWGLKIIEGEVGGRFTDSARKESASWVTCACGQQSANIPRSHCGEPDDHKLFHLGDDFVRKWWMMISLKLLEP